jgi:hypothetical protein
MSDNNQNNSGKHSIHNMSSQNFIFATIAIVGVILILSLTVNLLNTLYQNNIKKIGIISEEISSSSIMSIESNQLKDITIQEYPDFKLSYPGEKFETVTSNDNDGIVNINLKEKNKDAEIKVLIQPINSFDLNSMIGCWSELSKLDNGYVRVLSLKDNESQSMTNSEMMTSSNDSSQLSSSSSENHQIYYYYQKGFNFYDKNNSQFQETLKNTVEQYNLSEKEKNKCIVVGTSDIPFSTRYSSNGDEYRLSKVSIQLHGNIISEESKSLADYIVSNLKY